MSNTISYPMERFVWQDGKYIEREIKKALPVICLDGNLRYEKGDVVNHCYTVSEG